MQETSSRPPTAVFLSFAIAMGLGGLFFVPWLTVSCNPNSLTLPPELRGAGVPDELKDGAVLAHATGWDLARGELTAEDRFKQQAEAAGGAQEGPPAKTWAYGGLILPGLLAAGALLCLSGKISAAGAGKWMLLLGIGGVVLMGLAASMDYVDEAIDHAKDKMADQGLSFGGRTFQRDLDQAAERARDVLQTKATPYLWVCLGLYGLTAGCGMAALGAPEPIRRSQQVVWQTQDSKDPAGYLRGLADGPAKGEHAPTGMPSLGPAPAPREAHRPAP